MAKAVEAAVERERTFPLDEIGNSGEIEVPGKNVNVESEAFANEILTVRVATSALDPAPVYSSVNGISQYFIRGQKQKVKRKYVEALARARTYTYEQEAADPRDPSNIRMVERAVLSYPFEVLNDPNPKGREWLERILAS
jgi:hypothetical protein